MKQSFKGTDAYHATISEMAQKYSQHQLPLPHELIDPNDEHLLEDEEEDKDLLSVLSSNTMLYHQLSHLSVNSSQCSSKKVSFNFDMSPKTEMKGIQMDKSLFIDIFEQYFDDSKEGDIDIKEFTKG